MRVTHLGQICVGPTLSEEKIEKVRVALKDDARVGKIIKVHQLLSGETRYKLVKLLYDLEELCVCDMAEILATTVSAVSHQLKILRREGIVSTRRAGQTIYYSLQNKEIGKFL